MMYDENTPQIKKTLEVLRANNMEARFAPDCAAAYAYVQELLFDGAVVACGGSMSLAQCGLEALFKCGRYHYLDRAQTPPEAIPSLYRESFFADFYFTSANAVTENGELYNVDGNSNRVAAYCYGPKNVVVVAGCNKIVKDLKAAVLRVKNTAAPLNARRLERKTPCCETGVCIGIESSEMTAGCASPDRICCNYLVSAVQRERDRIKVILVGDTLGL